MGSTLGLQAKLKRLRELAGQDPEIMSNEARFSSRKMSKRLVAFDDMPFGGDETNSDMPAFVRKKSEEGSGQWAQGT